MRIEPITQGSEALNLAEVRLFTAAGSQYSNSQLNFTMSDILSGYPLESCFDGNVNTFTHSANANAWLRVTYPCKDGLSAVEVVNRADCCQSRILQYRMRSLGADGVTDLAPPFTFSSTQAFYFWQLAGGPTGVCWP